MTQMPGTSYRAMLPALTPPQESLATTLRRDVQTLALTIGQRNLSHRPRQLEQAAAFIEREFRQAGYDVRRQEYQIDQQTAANLEVEILGSTQADQIVVIGAHYDTVPHSPGANDNGSGVAATLALARALAKDRPARTIRFVAFANEEAPYGLTPQMGSFVYAKACKDRGENVVAMLSLETIGYYTDEPNTQRYPMPGADLIYPTTGNYIGFVGNPASAVLVAQAVGSFRQHAQFPSEGAAMGQDVRQAGWSDHWAFWQQGYPGLMVTDTAPFRYPHYHKSDDTPDKIDFDRMSRVVAGLEQVVRELANPVPQPPEVARQ